jgi:DNA-binding transcriptional LysR family regulator
MEAQAMLILSGHFIGFLPRHMGDEFAEKGQMRALKPQTYQFTSQHFAAYRAADAEQPLTKLLLRELRAQASDKRKE